MPFPAAQVWPGAVEQGQRRGDVVLPPLLVGHLHRPAVLEALELLPRLLRSSRPSRRLPLGGIPRGFSPSRAVSASPRAVSASCGQLPPSPSPVPQSATRGESDPEPGRPPPARTPPPPAPVAPAAASAARCLQLRPSPAPPRPAPGPVPPAGPAPRPRPGSGHRRRHLAGVPRPVVRLLRLRHRLHSATRSGSAPQPSSRAKASSSFSPGRHLAGSTPACPPTNGGWPVRMAQRTAPRPNTSLRSSTLSIGPDGLLRRHERRGAQERRRPASAGSRRVSSRGRGTCWPSSGLGGLGSGRRCGPWRAPSP